MNKFLPLLSLLFILLIGCKDKQVKQPDVLVEKTKPTKVEAPSTKSNQKTILCFGNSLTAGYGLEPEQAWPALLQERLDSVGQDFKVVNAGLSGETTSGGLNRLDWVLKQPVNMFILELGANDMLRGLDVASTKANLESIINKVKEKYPEAQIILAGMLAPPNMGDAYEKKFNRIFSDLAMKHKAVLIPFLLDEVAGRKELVLPDGKHPNVEGQKIVLENVWAALAPLFYISLPSTKKNTLERPIHLLV